MPKLNEKGYMIYVFFEVDEKNAIIKCLLKEGLQ